MEVEFFYLPGTLDGLIDHLLLLLAEFRAGNTATWNEIIAILHQLRDKNVITEQEYRKSIKEMPSTLS